MVCGPDVSLLQLRRVWLCMLACSTAVWYSSDYGSVVSQAKGNIGQTCLSAHRKLVMSD